MQQPYSQPRQLYAQHVVAFNNLSTGSGTSSNSLAVKFTTMRRRSQSNPNPRRVLPTYTHTHLSSPRHIRLITLLADDPIRGQVYIALTEHRIDSIGNGFTALSYTWDEPVELSELKRGPVDRSVQSPFHS
jgi:hypothetical protein